MFGDLKEWGTKQNGSPQNGKEMEEIKACGCCGNGPTWSLNIPIMSLVF